MSTVSIPPVSALDGEPCAQCRAPLAGDQRYCLQCGTRRNDAAGTSLDALVAAAAPGIPQVPGTAILASSAGHVQLAPAAPLGQPAAAWPVAGPVAVAAGGGLGGAPPPTRGGAAAGFVRSSAPFVSLAGLAVGVLIVGLLLGHWSSERVDAAPPTTTKIEITGLGALGTAAAAAPASAAADTGDASSSSTDSSSSSDAAASTPDPAAAAPPKDAVTAKDLTPAEIDKAAKKGKPIVTSGKKVPKDNKPAGGGSPFEDIG